MTTTEEELDRKATVILDRQIDTVFYGLDRFAVAIEKDPTTEYLVLKGLIAIMIHRVRQRFGLLKMLDLFPGALYFAVFRHKLLDWNAYEPQ